MIKITLIIISLALLSGCSILHKQGKPHPRDWLYGSAATLEVLDAYSTSVAFHENSNAYEQGRLLRAYAGDRPNDKQLLIFTAAKIGMLEWSRHWHNFFRVYYQLGVVVSRPGIIRANFKVAFDGK